MPAVLFRRSAAAQMVLALLLLLLAAAPAAGAGTTAPADDVKVTADVQYGSGGELLLDVYRRPGSRDAPVVILIHGGGWSAGDKDKFDDESRALAKADFVVFDINYTLEPNSGAAYPRQVRDVHTALQWVQDNAATYGGDPARIGVLGGSAGAYLAAMLAYQANTASAQPVRAMVSLSGPMDLPVIVDSLRTAGPTAGGTCEPLSCEALEGATSSVVTLLGCRPDRCSDDLLAEASPTSYVSQYSPPSYFANGTLEVVRPEQTEAIAALLRADGVHVETAAVPGDLHSVELLPAVGRDVLAFLTDNLQVEPVPPTTTPTTPPPVAPADNGSGVPASWFVAAGLLALLGLIVLVRRSRTETPAAR